VGLIAVFNGVAGIETAFLSVLVFPESKIGSGGEEESD